MNSIKTAIRFLLVIALVVVPIIEPVVAHAQSAPQEPFKRALSAFSLLSTPSSFRITNAVGDQTNQSYITYTALDKDSNIIPGAVFNIWLSDRTDCNGVTATASSGTGGLTVGTGGGTAGTSAVLGMGVSTTGLTAGTFNVTNSKVPLTVQADVNGQVKYGILDSAKTLFIPCAQTILAGVKAGSALTASSYK